MSRRCRHAGWPACRSPPRRSGSATGSRRPERTRADGAAAAASLHGSPPNRRTSPGVGTQQTEENPDRRRLASTVRAQEAVHLTRCHDQIQPVQRPRATEGLHQAVDLDRARHPISLTKRPSMQPLVNAEARDRAVRRCPGLLRCLGLEAPVGRCGHGHRRRRQAPPAGPARDLGGRSGRLCVERACQATQGAMTQGDKSARVRVARSTPLARCHACVHGSDAAARLHRWVGPGRAR